ncbi:MAG: family 16 glycosylhydrolase [Flavobacteriia bacterium]
MKSFKIVLHLMFFFYSSIVFSQCDWQNVVIVDDINCLNGNWVICFEDNFDKNEIDFSKWKVPYQGVIRDFNFGSEKQWYVNSGSIPSIPISNNIEVSNGNLNITSRKEDVNGTYIDWTLTPPAMTSSNFNYTSAQLESKYRFGYGIYEIRCKIPKGKGFWPAFWLYNGYNNAELDIFEFWNEDNLVGVYNPNLLSSVVNTNMHYKHVNNGVITQMCPEKVGQGTDYSEDFHIFTFEWDPYKARWYIDGILVREKYRYYTMSVQEIDCNTLQPFHEYISITNFPLVENFNVLFNTAIQNGSNNEPDINTIFPSIFEIDYFRYWKKTNCSGDLFAQVNDDLELSQECYNIIIKDNISIGGGIILELNQQVDLKASNSILIEPGAQLLGAFEAWIAPCNEYKNNTINSSDFGKPLLSSNPNRNLELSSNVDLERVEGEDFISLIPNPFTSNFQIKSNLNENFRYTIINSTGIPIFKSSVLEQGEYNVELNNCTSGVYIIKLEYLLSKQTFFKRIEKI